MSVPTEIGPPRVETSGPLRIAGLNGHYTSETVKNIPGQWQRFGPYLGTVPGQVGRAAYGVCCNMSNEVAGFDYLTGVEVSEFTRLPEEFGRFAFPAQRYLVFPYLEHVSRLGETIHAIFTKWLPASGHETTQNTDFFERYGEKFDVEAGRGDVEIWIPISK
jgi:AraC family transcriptional regulator